MVSEGVWVMSRWCLRVSGEASMPNLFMILRYCLSSSAGIAKMPCIGVCELCRGVSGWGLRVSGDALIQNNLSQIYIGHVSSDAAFYSSTR